MKKKLGVIQCTKRLTSWKAALFGRAGGRGSEERAQAGAETASGINTYVISAWELRVWGLTGQ